MATIEGPLTNLGDRVGDSHSRQAIAILERIFGDGNDWGGQYAGCENGVTFSI